MTKSTLLIAIKDKGIVTEHLSKIFNPSVKIPKAKIIDAIIVKILSLLVSKTISIL